MKILAIETSGEDGSVALQVDGQVLEARLQGHARHSENLLGVVKDLLAQAGLDLAGLDGLAFGAGPGAFTGVRLACGVAQGLALGSGLPLIPVSSLQALALQGPAGPVLVAVDARMGEIYTAQFHNDGLDARESSPARCCPPEDLALSGGGPWAGVGSGFGAYPQRISAEVSAALASLDAQAVPRAAAIARLAAPRLARGETVSASQATPLYVRDKVALTTAERLARGARG
jgi:tRNA threonylcarbamoyladenosine biosynthesis protein TsaB